ncbi:MAG: hypothetical protein V4531_10175 [Actinomycetota bacterium]
MTAALHAVTTAIVMLANTPTPKPSFNENSVTPTWVGFAATFAVAAVVVLLSVDLVRRVRRVRYRAEIREQLESERDAAAEPDAPTDRRSSKPEG